MHHKEGLLSVHAAILIFGLTALFSKLISLSALEITLYRSIIAALVLYLLVLFKRESLKLEATRDYALVIVLGILLASHWVTYFHAMQISSVAVGVIALYTYPVMTVFIEPLFHGERPHIADIFSGFAVSFGIYLMVPALDLDHSVTQGILWGVFSALLFSLRNIMQKRYFSHYSARQSLLYQSIVVFIVLMPFGVEQVFHVSAYAWGQLIILGIFFTALPHVLFVHSLRFLKAKTTSLIACLQVVYAALFAFLLLGEVPQVSTIVGGLIVISAAVYESYFAHSQLRRVTA